MNEFIKKLGSGRLFLVIMCGLSFIYAVVTRYLTAETVGAIVVMVFSAYFHRSDRNGKESNGNGQDNGVASK